MLSKEKKIPILLNFIVSDITAPSFRKGLKFFESRNVLDLSEKIDQLLQNIEQLKTLARNKQEQYCNEFNINSVASRYLGCYQDLLKNHKK